MTSLLPTMPRPAKLQSDRSIDRLIDQRGLDAFTSRVKRGYSDLEQKPPKQGEDDLMRPPPFTTSLPLPSIPPPFPSSDNFDVTPGTPLQQHALPAHTRSPIISPNNGHPILNCMQWRRRELFLLPTMRPGDHMTGICNSSLGSPATHRQDEQPL